MSILRFVLLSTLLLSTTLWASVGKVALLKGEAFLERGTQKIALQNGSVLEEKDTIQTSKETQIQIIFEDKTVITLGSESTLSIEEYLNDANKPKAKFKFGEGTFKTITGQIGKKAPENFTMETKTATIGIRGTTVRGHVRQGGDTIACLSGSIAVGAIGSPNIVVVPAGKSTFVAPGSPPTPPQTITQQSGGTLTGGDNPSPANGDTPPSTGDTPPPPINNFSSVVNQANNNDLNDRVKEVVTSAPVYNGFITSFLYDAQEVEHDFIGQAVSYSKHPEIGLFTFSAPAYEINPLTGALSQVSPSFSGEVYTNTDHYGYNADSMPNVTATAIPNTSFSQFDYTNPENYSTERIWYDAQSEIAIYSLTNRSTPTFLFVGPQSSTLPDTGLLYFLDNGGMYNGTNNDVSSLISRHLGVDMEDNDIYDATAVILNNTNKKVLSLYFDSYGPMIGIGKLNNNASMEMKRYWYWSDDSYFEIGTNTLIGAIYGSDNQALAVSGIESYIHQYSGEGTSIDPTEYYATYGVALKDISERIAPSANYANVQTITGTLSQHNLDGSATHYDDLSIVIKKTQGTVSVASSALEIPETISAYIHDNYFATVSTTTFQGTEVMKDYLMAIPYGSGEDDYVSWGYWGKTSYADGVISTSTTPTPFNTWVAGIQTPTDIIDNLIATSKIYNYSGNVIGSVMEHGTTGAILNNANNLLDMNIKFGTSSITGSMSFDTSLNTSWFSTITSAEVNPLSNTGFNAILSGAHSSETLVSGTLNGKFYGPTANNVAGAFTLSDEATTKKVVGSFKAIKQIPAP